MGASLNGVRPNNTEDLNIQQYNCNERKCIIANFDVFLTVHHSIDLFNLPTLTYSSFIH